MTRTTGVTVCVVAGDDRRATRRFLDGLAPALNDHDNVVVVGQGRPPASDASAWRALAGKAGLRPIGRDEAPRPRPVVVLVDDRVDPPEGWLALLVDALGEPGVAAVAPRSNAADGDELFVGIPYRPDEHGLRRRFARDLALGARGQLSEATILDGPCIAVRREMLEDIGGLAPILGKGYDPAGMSIRIRAAGGRLVIAESCFLHHPGGPSRRPDPRHAGRPFVSACLIVRDEEENLADCLAAIAGLADEIVVYDTGSLDRTVDIAEQAGATVVRGYWDDDFGRARNDALEHCRGQWILWVDADEQLVCDDPAAVRRELMALATDVEAYVVLIDNLNGNQAAFTFTHPACRLFRRAYGHWEGHLHELVVARAGTRELARPLFRAGRILHRGYLQTFITERSKGDRNLRTAFGDLAGGSNLDWGFRLSSLGRSYAGAGRFEEAVEHCRNAAEVAERASTARLARRTAIECLLALGRNDEALEELGRLRQTPGSQLLGDLLEGRVRQALGEGETALECFSRVRATIDDDGFEYSPAMVAAPRAEILRSMGRHDEAAATLIGALRDGDGIDAHLGLLIESLEIAGRDLGEIYDVLGDERVEHFVPQLVQLQPAVADRVLESWRARAPDSRPVLAAAASVARHLEVARQLVWSARLREAGYPSACPLVAAAIDPTVGARDRVLSGAVAVAMFADSRARHAFGPAVLGVPSGQRAQLETEIAAIAPDLLGALRSLDATPERAHPVADPTGKRVLIVECRPADLRSAGLANHLVAAGHEVTLVGPRVAEQHGNRILAGTVHFEGFLSPSSTRQHRLDACRAALTICSASQGFDVVIVSRSATELLPIARSLYPEVTVVADGHSADSVDQSQTEAATVWGVDSEPTFTPELALKIEVEVELETNSFSALERQPDTPLAGRFGMCVVGDAGDDQKAAPGGSHWERALAATRARCPGATAAVCLDTGLRPPPDLGDVLIVGPTSDPASWLRGARVAVVTPGGDADGWLEAARACGTPAVTLGRDAESLDHVVREIAELLEDDLAWEQAHSTLGSAGSKASARIEIPLPEAAQRAKVDGQAPTGVHSFQLVGDDGPLAVWRRSAPALLSYLRKLAASTSRVDAGPNVLELRDAPTPDFHRTPGTRIVPLVAWDYGGLPAEWIAPIRDVASEIWVPSIWARDRATTSGVATDKVYVVGPGIDVSVFCPTGPRYRLATARPKRLLFVGTASEQDGIDALLEAYLTAFEGHGDVCLVLNLQPEVPTSRSASFEGEIRRAAAAKHGAIEIVDGALTPVERAELYRACDALVAPHRARAFATTIAEAMACELPVVTLDRGPQAELCSKDTAWLVASREVGFSVGGWTPTTAGFSWNEPSRGSLVQAMRDVLRDRDAAKLKVSQAREYVLGRYTVEAAIAAAERRVSALLSVPGS